MGYNLISAINVPETDFDIEEEYRLRIPLSQNWERGGESEARGRSPGEEPE
jgi:hypothetical protein